jgi:hypothetical protein
VREISHKTQKRIANRFPKTRLEIVDARFDVHRADITRPANAFIETDKYGF